MLDRFAQQWLPLKYAAKFLGCAQTEAQQQLATAGVSSRFVGRGGSGTFMYRRGDVERVFYEQQGGTQLSCF
ncbi:MAG: hypothetical protein HC769_23475 [Cyanobacteria bacterium CRU_2_1]|nr:hypothetical protein [Cyanobacteria bacterium CRU_2_1]